MASLASASVVRQIGSLFEGGSVAGLSDRQLLDRFISERDSAGEAAFAALVVRHGSLVLAVCVDVLADRHDAEDAFQAVFLILAQKARSIREPELLANWLYGVALRTARHAKLRRRHRRRTENASTLMKATSMRRGFVRSAVTAGPRAGRGPARGDRTIAACVPATSCPLLPPGSDCP